MRGNSQNGGQTTKSLLTKPQCSGVPIQQAVSLSSSFPRHCLLFVCAFFREIQADSRSECPLLPAPPHTKTAPASITETGAVRLLYLCFFKRSRNYLRGFLIAAWAGAKIAERSGITYTDLYSFLRLRIIVHSSVALATLLFHQDPDTPFSHLYCTDQAYP